MKKIISLLFILVFFNISVSQATLVKPVNIEVLTSLAQTIVQAEVIHIQTELDPYESGKMVTYYTLKVNDWIKGSGQNDEIVIKQLSDGEYVANNGQKIRQNLFFPKYNLNQTYIFFLPEAHGVTGLLAPVGLWQGVFDVVKDENGNVSVPQLLSPMRQKMLAKDLQSESQNKFLSLQLNAKKPDSSYQSFKALVQSIK